MTRTARASFNLLQHHASKLHLQFYAFDMPVYRGRSLLHVPLETRRALLEEALAKVDYVVLFSRSFDAKPTDLIRAAKELQLDRQAPAHMLRGRASKSSTRTLQRLVQGARGSQPRLEWEAFPGRVKLDRGREE